MKTKLKNNRLEFCDNSMLNLPGHHSTAAISYNMHLVEGSLSGDINLSDCSRQVTLDLYCEDEEDLDNLIFKLNTLHQHIGEVRQQLNIIAPISRIKHQHLDDGVGYDLKQFLGGFYQLLLLRELNIITNKDFRKKCKAIAKSRKQTDNKKFIKTVAKHLKRMSFIDESLCKTIISILDKKLKKKEDEKTMESTVTDDSTKNN